MFKWILLFLMLGAFVALTFAGAMLDASMLLFSKAMLLTMIVASMLYFARRAHSESDTLLGDEKPL